MKPTKQTYSPTDVAAALGVSESAAYELFHAEGFPSFRIGSRWLVMRDDFADWLRKQQNAKVASSRK